VLIKLSWCFSGAVGTKSAPPCILYISPPCLALPLGISVSAFEALLPKSDELIPNAKMVKRSPIYFLLIDSGKKVRQLEKEALIFNLMPLGGFSFIVCFSVEFGRHSLCFLPCVLVHAVSLSRTPWAPPFSLTFFL
jgi:hypothetical protein